MYACMGMHIMYIYNNIMCYFTLHELIVHKEREIESMHLFYCYYPNKHMRLKADMPPHTLPKEFGYINHSFGHLSSKCACMQDGVYFNRLHFTMSNGSMIPSLVFPLK